MKLVKFLILAFPLSILATEVLNQGMFSNLITTFNTVVSTLSIGSYLLRLKTYYDKIKEKAKTVHSYGQSAVEKARGIKDKAVDHARNISNHAKNLKDKTHAHLKTHFENVKNKYNEMRQKSQEDLENEQLADTQDDEMSGEEKIRELLKRLAENLQKAKQKQLTGDVPEVGNKTTGTVQDYNENKQSDENFDDSSDEEKKEKKEL